MIQKALKDQISGVETIDDYGTLIFGRDALWARKRRKRVTDGIQGVGRDSAEQAGEEEAAG